MNRRRSQAILVTLLLGATLPLSACDKLAATNASNCAAADIISVAPVAVQVTAPQLSDQQRKNAQIILGVAKSIGLPDWVGTFSVAVAYHESGLINLPSGDGASVNLFQQTDVYGSVQQRMDPIWAATMFMKGGPGANGSKISGLIDIPNWESYADGNNWDRLAIAIQRPSESAYYSSAHNIRDNIAKIKLWLGNGTTLAGSSGVQQVSALNCRPSGSAISTLLTAARSQVGLAYTWPDTAGGSGFTQWVYKSSQVDLPLGVEEQKKKASAVDGGKWSPADGQDAYARMLSKLQPGDLLFVGSSRVMLYVGNGNVMRNEPSGKALAVQSVSSVVHQSETVEAARVQLPDVASQAGVGGWAFPLANLAETSPCGPRWGKLHAGQDYGVPVGTPVMVIGNGTVAQTQTTVQSGGYGNRVVVSHGKINGVDIVSTYNHLDAIKVVVGQEVTKGTVVGLSGNTGDSTGPHLHAEVKEGSTFVDLPKFVSSGGLTTTRCDNGQPVSIGGGVTT